MSYGGGTHATPSASATVRAEIAAEPGSCEDIGSCGEGVGTGMQVQELGEALGADGEGDAESVGAGAFGQGYSSRLKVSPTILTLSSPCRPGLRPEVQVPT